MKYRGEPSRLVLWDSVLSTDRFWLKKSSQLDFRIVCVALIYGVDVDRFKALTRFVNQFCSEW
jgi:hypothetical protein